MRYLLSFLLCLSLTVPTLAKTVTRPVGSENHAKRIKRKTIKPAKQNKYKAPKGARHKRMAKPKVTAKSSA